MEFDETEDTEETAEVEEMDTFHLSMTYSATHINDALDGARAAARCAQDALDAAEGAWAALRAAIVLDNAGAAGGKVAAALSLSQDSAHLAITAASWMQEYSLRIMRSAGDCLRELSAARGAEGGGLSRSDSSSRPAARWS